MIADSPTPRPRWKLLVCLVALPWVGVALLNYLPALDKYKFAGTGVGVMAVLATIVLITLWLLALSRLRWKTRLRGVALMVLLGTAAAFMVRKDGHMGDFLPQLAWRWQSKPGEDLKPLEIAAPSGALKFTTDQPGDSPQFLGPGGQNHVSADKLASNWPTQPFKELWRREVGLGWSGFCVAGDFAITQEQRGDQEMVVAYDKSTGKPLWQHVETARFEESMGGNGPRSTPTAHQGRVYAMGATGILVCLDGITGKLVWKRDTLAEAKHENLMWAKSNSPLISGDHVIITLGKGPQTLAAYSQADGAPVWRSGPTEASYGSPVLVQRDGKPEIIAVFAKSAGGFDPATGNSTWTWTEGFRGAPANVANPVFLAPDRVLVSIGYGVGSTLLKISANTPPEILWETIKMKPKFTNLVVRNGHAWGLDEGRLSCLNLETGEQIWRGSSYGHGQIMGIGENLLIQAERGEIVIVTANTTEETVVATIPALTSKTWNQPCLSGNTLLVRNDREIIAFELAAVP